MQTQEYKVVLVTGGFDPIHSGHIKYMKEARELGDELIVGLNSDEWLTRKKGKPFMPFFERAEIIQNFRFVDSVISFDDMDGTSIQAIKKVRELYPNHTLIFANGGDRNTNNVPEMSVKDNKLIFKFGIGGDAKQNSSSWILNDWTNK